MVRGRNHLRHNPPQSPRCPFCYSLFQSPYYLDIHIVKTHLQMTCRLCGLVRDGFFGIVSHFVVDHMRRNVYSAQNLLDYVSMLREIPIANFELGVLEDVACSQPGLMLRFILSNPDLMPSQSASDQGLDSTDSEAGEDTESDDGGEGSDESDA